MPRGLLVVMVNRFLEAERSVAKVSSTSIEAQLLMSTETGYTLYEFLLAS